MDNLGQYNCFLDIVKKRRTIRQFKSDPIPDEYITKIIEAARWAPSGFHTQPWEFVIIKDPVIKNKIIAALGKKAPPIKDPSKKTIERKSYKDAPVFILALCDWRAKIGLPGSPRSNEQAAGLYTSSMANSFLLMHLAATSLGLASQWYTATSSPEAEKAIREIIGIPKDLTIYDMMVLGYEAAPPGPKIIRDTKEMMHFDACGEKDFRTDEEVIAYAEKTKVWCLSEH
jgi:nitroreductase